MLYVEIICRGLEKAQIYICALSNQEAVTSLKEATQFTEVMEPRSKFQINSPILV